VREDMQLYLSNIMMNKASYFTDGNYNFTKIHFMLEEYFKDFIKLNPMDLNTYEIFKD